MLFFINTRFLTLLLCILLWSPAVIAQKVAGTIVDRDNKPVELATIIVLQVSDSTIVQGTTTDGKGRFLFENIEDGSYLIKASFIGFEANYKAFSVVGNDDIELGKISLVENVQELDEVNVSAKKPTIVRKPDRLIFSVENTAVSSGSSWDILKVTPGVVVIQDALLVRGQNTTIYLNDKKVQITPSELKTLLESFSGEHIGTVEVIFNPSANFDAEGGSVLNIKTNKNIALGYKGSIEAAYTQAIFAKYRIGTSHFYKTKKVNLFIGYSHNPRKEFKEDNNTANFINQQNEVFASWDADFNRTTRSQAHNLNAIFDYDIDEKNQLGVVIVGLHSPNIDFDNNQITNAFDDNKQLDSVFINQSSLTTDIDNIGVDLSYKRQLKKEGSQLSTNVHYTRYTRGRTQNLNTNYFDNNDIFLRNVSFFTSASQAINIYTAQVDYKVPLGEIPFETGIKFSGIDSESGIDFFDINNGQRSFNTQNSDNFLYDESVFAAYALIAKDWEKWSIKIGLRAEQTNVEAISVQLPEINNQDYLEWFPSINLQHRFNDNHSIGFDYKRSINRPRYEELNPFAYFLNENNFQIGNPELIPNFSHNFNFNYTLKESYFFDIYYRDNGRYISNLSFQDNERLILSAQNQNVLESISYGLDFVHGRSITNWWYFYTYMSLFYEKETFLAVESDNVPFKNDIEGFYGQFYNSFSLSKDGTFSSELTLNYISGFIYGSYIQDPTTDLTISLRKSFWKKKAVVTITGADLLGKANSRLTSRYLNQDNSFLAVPETQFVRFGFKYNFGNYRLGDNKRDLDKKERERL